MGVCRAMELVLSEANKDEGPLLTYGPLIHNNQVLDLLRSKGVNSVEDLSGLESGRIVIRAHGIPPEQRKMIKKTHLNGSPLLNRFLEKWIKLFSCWLVMVPFD